MHPNYRNRCLLGTPLKSDGFTIIGVIFLLLVISLTGTYFLSLIGQSSQQVNLKIIRNRVDAAARAGIEVALHDLTTVPASCPTQTITFGANDGALNGITVDIACTNTSTHLEEFTMVYIHEIEARAQSGTFGSAEYAQKILSVQAIAGN